MMPGLSSSRSRTSNEQQRNASLRERIEVAPSFARHARRASFGLPVEAQLVQGKVTVPEMLLPGRRFLERHEQQVVSAAAARRLDARIVVAELALAGALIKRCAELDSEIAGVQSQRDHLVELMWIGKHRVAGSQDRHEGRDLLPKHRLTDPLRPCTLGGCDVLAVQNDEQHRCDSLVPGCYWPSE